MQAEIKSIGEERRRRGERGTALIAALLMLLLVTGLSSVMAVTLNSDVLMNGYFGSFRGSFYAADSGLALARQEMLNQLIGSVSSSFSTSSAPITNGTESSVLSTVLGEFSTSASSPVTIAATSSWPAQFYLDTSTPSGSSTANTSLKLATCSVTPTGGSTTTQTNGTCPAPPSGYTGYQYAYDYQYVVRAIGISQGGQNAAVREEGDLIINVTASSSLSTARKFSAWGTFLNVSPQCNAELIGGTITGPQFTNGSWTFGDDYTYTFTDPVGSVSSTAGYYFGSNACYSSSQPSYTYNQYGWGGGQTIAPTFQGGLNLGQNALPVPANDYNQARAVLDSQGTSNAQVTNSDLNGSVKDVNGNAYNINGASSGVYLPYTINPQTGAATFNGGGIYVQGDASVTLTASGNTAQVYTIAQGSTTTTITIDNTANTTTFSSTTGSTTTTKTISGVPVMYLSSGGTPSNATMLYVNGNITSLSGPGSTGAAIQDGNAITVTAANNITITNNILYKTEPVTLTAAGSTPVGSLITGNNNGQALGIFTANGTVILNPPGSGGGNLEIDASIAATSTADSNSSCSLSYICKGSISVADGNTINTLSIVGGRIQNIAQVMPAGTINTRNIIYDRRYQGGGFAPPFFPSTTVTTTSGSTDYSTVITGTLQRKEWVSEIAY